MSDKRGFTVYIYHFNTYLIRVISFDKRSMGNSDFTQCCKKMHLYMTSKNEEARDELVFHFPNMIIYASTRYSLIDMFLPKLPYFKKGNKFHNLLKILCFHTIMHQEDCVDKVMQMCHRK